MIVVKMMSCGFSLFSLSCYFFDGFFRLVAVEKVFFCRFRKVRGEFCLSDSLEYSEKFSLILDIDLRLFFPRFVFCLNFFPGESFVSSLNGLKCVVDSQIFVFFSGKQYNSSK